MVLPSLIHGERILKILGIFLSATTTTIIINKISEPGPGGSLLWVTDSVIKTGISERIFVKGDGNGRQKLFKLVKEGLDVAQQYNAL